MLSKEQQINAIILKSHLKLFALGFKNSRFSGTKILNKTSKITGNKYKRGAYTKAINDLNSILNSQNNVNNT